MSYAGDRTIFDADSHLMELPDFLSAHADPKVRDRLPRLGDLTTGQFNPGDHVGKAGHAPEVVARLKELGDNITRGPKWHDALGAKVAPHPVAQHARLADVQGFARAVGVDVNARLLRQPRYLGLEITDWHALHCEFWRSPEPFIIALQTRQP